MRRQVLAAEHNCAGCAGHQCRSSSVGFAIYSRPFVAVTIGLMVLFGGSYWGAFKLLGRVW
jgi:hypothetical protein